MMLGIQHFESFLLAGILLNLTPGNDTVFVLSRSIAQGKKAGVMSALGIATGSLVHTALAAFGLSILLSESALAFQVIKYCGAAYLVFIGIKMLSAPAPGFDLETGQRQRYARIYRDAVVTNVFNPKVALFFISFLPQFIDAGFQQPAIPFLLLGLSFTLTGTLWCLVLASSASFLALKLKTNRRLALYINRLCGGVIIALGIKVALERR